MKTTTKLLCKHCQSPIAETKVSYSDYLFCCHGCKNVYQLLSESNLCEYYNIDPEAGIRIDLDARSNKYDILDRKEYRDRIVKFTDGTRTHVLFSIPQIHCSSCLWLLERLYKINSHILSTEVYYEKKEVYIIFDESKLDIKNLVATLSSIGYEPYLNFEVDDSSNIYSKRTEILKIGVAGFCFANIMMLSLPEYFSAGIIHETLFKNIIPYFLVGLSLPVLFFAATGFFVSAYTGLRKGILNIDLPVSIAIAITFIRSLSDIYYGVSNGYLDSMSGIVFFMLIGRWLQHRTQTYLQFDRNYLSYFPIAVERIKGNMVSMTPIQEVEIHDTIKIYPNEIIPVDSILSKGVAMIDYSFVNGESTIVSHNIGENIYAGGRQTGRAIELVVVKKHSQSQLTTLWNHYSFQNKKEQSSSTWVDYIGIYFSVIVLAMSAIAGLYWYSHGEYTRMWNAISTVLIVACPCALLLANSFTKGQILRILGKYNFYMRSGQIIDKLYRIRHIIFDKTGTLTHNHQHNLLYEGLALSEQQKIALASILYHSSHPLAKSIYKILQVDTPLQDVNYKETLGQGIEGWIDNVYYKLGSDDFCGLERTSKHTHVHILIDHDHVGTYTFYNVYRSGISSLLDSLQKKYKISILSGDNDSEYSNLRKILYPDNNILFYQTPVDKLEYTVNIEKSGNNVLMIGDGLNDSGAFQASSIAVALTKKNNFFNPASDIILDEDNLPYLIRFLEFIQKTNTIIKIAFAYSILYNVVGLYYALRGVLSPVIAAILMPISSISIILFIHWMSAYYEKKYLSTISNSKYSA